MALIIDERIAGGRPQKRIGPSMASVGSATGRAVHSVHLLRITRPPRTRSILAWARA